MAFLKKVHELAEEKVECQENPADIHKIKRRSLLEEIWKVCEEYVHVFLADLPKNCHLRDWIKISGSM